MSGNPSKKVTEMVRKVVTVDNPSAFVRQVYRTSWLRNILVKQPANKPGQYLVNLLSGRPQYGTLFRLFWRTRSDLFCLHRPIPHLENKTGHFTLFIAHESHLRVHRR